MKSPESSSERLFQTSGRSVLRTYTASWASARLVEVDQAASSGCIRPSGTASALLRPPPAALV